MALILYRCIFLLFLWRVSAAPPIGRGTYTTRATPTPFRPWNSARNRIVNALFGSDLGSPTPEVATKGSKNSNGGVKNANSNQVILRFYVNNTLEAEAVTGVCDGLFVDVWERSRTWIDVRLAEDVVSPLMRRLPGPLREPERFSVLMSGTDLVHAVAGARPSYDDATRFQLRGHERLPQTSAPSKPASRSSNAFFEDYRSYDVLLPWMRLMQSTFGTHVRFISVGKSYEQRDIAALRVGVSPTNDEAPPTKRKTILITGGIRARDWLSTATAAQVAYSIITAYGREPTPWTKLLHEYDWVFIPTLNPDGYQYTWDTDRLWQKNRQPGHLPLCRGINLDRTFNVTEADTNANPCSELYGGSSSFTGNEVAALTSWARDQVDNNNVEFIAYLDLQGYSQYVLHASSGTCNGVSDASVNEVGRGLAAALSSQHDETYAFVPSCDEDASSSIALTPSPSSALAWFSDALNITHAYQIKLRDLGERGFLVPREQILPSGQEVLRAVEFLGSALANATETSTEHISLPIPEKYTVKTELRDNEDDEIASHTMDLRRRRRR